MQAGTQGRFVSQAAGATKSSKKRQITHVHHMEHEVFLVLRLRPTGYTDVLNNVVLINL